MIVLTITLSSVTNGWFSNSIELILFLGSGSNVRNKQSKHY